MRITFAFAAFLASWTAVLAAPTWSEGFIGLKNDAPAVNSTGGNEFIFMFKPSEVENQAAEALQLVEMSPEDDSVQVYQNPVFTCIIMKNVSTKVLEAFKAMDNIAHVEEKITIKTYATQKTGSPWGLQRISSAAGASGSPQGQDFTYSFDDASLGAGVDIYIVDTGVRTSHAVFQGRASEGFSFNTTAADGDGHGTHVAGTAAGAKFGVAQGANIIAVKVLGDDGSGSSSDTIAGMDWVITNHNKRKTQDGFVGSIMSMSWGLAGTAATVDQVVVGAVEAGIHVSVAAGNDGADACQSTPSHNGGSNSAVVSVGSINISNDISTFSNIGSCVDIYAPGEQILSSWNTGDNIINFLSGTSMACPHTSGVMAYLMAQNRTLGQDPAALKAKLLASARSNIVSGNAGGGASLLLSNGVDGTLKRLMKDYVVPSDMPEQKRTVTGSPASWAKDLVKDLDKRWSLHSTDSPLRF